MFLFLMNTFTTIHTNLWLHMCICMYCLVLYICLMLYTNTGLFMILTWPIVDRGGKYQLRPGHTQQHCILTQSNWMKVALKMKTNKLKSFKGLMWQIKLVYSMVLAIFVSFMFSLYVCNATHHYKFEIFPFPALKSGDYFRFVTSEFWVQSSISFKEKMS